MGVFSLIVVFEGLSTHSEAMSTQAYLVLSAGVALTGAYIFTINWAGFVIPTLISTSLMPITLGYKKWKTMLILSVIYSLGVWYIFEKVFLIILPSSPWFEVF
jgi:putative tricarboxylic transport membrane protein